MKYAKYIVVTVIIVLVILAIVFQDKIRGWFTKKPAAAQLETSAGNNAGGGGNGSSAPQLNYNRLLKFGSNGAEVRQLQKWLGITADGIFGAQTEAALMARKGVEEITLAQFENSADVTESFAGDGNDSNGDILGWSDSNNSLIDGLQGWIFDWVS